MNEKVDIKSLRIEMLVGITMYCLFAFLDQEAMPLNYRTAWFIRFAIVLPFALMVFLLSFVRPLKKHMKKPVYAMLLLGQIGLFIIIAVSKSSEPAYYSYYQGTVLILIACEFMFQMTWKPAAVFFLLSLAMYLGIIIFVQKLFASAAYGYDISWLIGNLTFYVATGLLSLLGLVRIQQSRDAAKKADDLKSSFLVNISHEIRTPLNGLLGCASLLTSPSSNAAEVKKYRKIIDYCGNQLVDIVDNILFMSEIEKGKSELHLENISLKDFLFDLSNHFEIQAESKGLEFIYEDWITTAQNTFRTDLVKLRTILNNILNNALKFTDNGRITLRAGRLSSELRFIIEDSGIGFDMEQAGHIFDSFYQVDKGYSRTYGGNGLGLSITKSYLEMLGGRIDVDSTPGRGSVFTVTIPELPPLKPAR